MYIFKFSFVRTLVHEEFGGYKTSDVLRSDWFCFNDYEDFSSRFVGHVLAAASSDLAGRGVRVYNFFELFGVLRSSLDSFVSSSDERYVRCLSDQTPDNVPTRSVCSVDLHYMFQRSNLSEAELSQLGHEES